MIGITFNTDETPWTNLAHAVIDPDTIGEVVKVGRMPGGMKDGASVIVIHLRTKEGRDIIARAPLASFSVAVEALATEDRRKQ